MKEFTNKKTGSFGFIVKTFFARGEEWADVIAFTKSGKRNATMKMADLTIDD